MVSDVMSGPPTKKSHDLTAAIINRADNWNLAAKLTITQKEGSVTYFTTHVEEVLSEILKISAK